MFLLLKSLDRLSRDQEDMASIYKKLTFGGIDIITVHEGRADQIQVGVRGIVSAFYLTDLAHKVRRGAAGKSGRVNTLAVWPMGIERRWESRVNG